MATAPRPGSAGTTSGEEKVEAARQVVTMTLRNPDHADPDKREIVRTLNIGAIAFKERLVVRRATRLPFEAFVVDGDEQAVGLDTLQVWWWLAMRGEGGPTITLEKALDEWPDDIGPDTFDVSIDDGEDDDPQS